MGTPPQLCHSVGGRFASGLLRSPGGSPQLKTPATQPKTHGPERRRRLLSDPNASTASANASVVVPHITFATAALVVALFVDKLCQCGVQLERGIPPALPAAAMLLTSSLPLPPLLPP